MSQGSTGGYKLEHVPAATEQIHAIAAIAKQTGKLKAFQDILFEAVRRLKDDPHGWGDPAYHKAVGGGLVCHALIRPIAIHYVIYESLHAVVLLDVHQFAEFD